MHSVSDYTFRAHDSAGHHARRVLKPSDMARCQDEQTVAQDKRVEDVGMAAPLVQNVLRHILRCPRTILVHLLVECRKVHWRPLLLRHALSTLLNPFLAAHGYLHRLYWLLRGPKEKSDRVEYRYTNADLRCGR